MDKCLDLIGVPFEYGGRGPDALDCYGLVMEVAKRNGTPLPDFGFASDQAMISAMMGCTMPQWEEIEQVAGAIVLFRIGRYVSHCGVMIDESRMIHTWKESGGVTIQPIDLWTQRIVGFYKHVGN